MKRYTYLFLKNKGSSLFWAQRNLVLYYTLNLNLEPQPQGEK